MEHTHKERIIVIDGSCPKCNRISAAIDRVLADHEIVVTSTGVTFNPPLHGQKLVDAVRN